MLNLVLGMGVFSLLPIVTSFGDLVTIFGMWTLVAPARDLVTISRKTPFSTSKRFSSNLGHCGRQGIRMMLTLISLADLKEEGQGTPQEFRVFGYLPEYRLGGFNYSAAFNTGLTHLIFFSLEIDPKTGHPSALDRLPSKRAAAEARAAADKVSSHPPHWKKGGLSQQARFTGD